MSKKESRFIKYDEPARGRSAGIRTPGLLVPKIGLKIQPAPSGAFGAVCPGNSCFPGLSPPMVPCAPGVIWVGVWVSGRTRRTMPISQTLPKSPQALSAVVNKISSTAWSMINQLA